MTERAGFEFDRQPECDATVIERELCESSFPVIDLLEENGDAWYEFFVSEKAFECVDRLIDEPQPLDGGCLGDEQRRVTDPRNLPGVR